jgi:hypothetical protein
MAATLSDIQRLRYMVGEPTSLTYTDDRIREMIEKFPLTDAAGYDPTLPDGEVNSLWTPLYDLHAAASEIWAEKAALQSGKMDFSVEGGGFKASQLQENAMKMSRYHASRRAIRALRIEPQPKS